MRALKEVIIAGKKITLRIFVAVPLSSYMYMNPHELFCCLNDKDHGTCDTTLPVGIPRTY